MYQQISKRKTVMFSVFVAMLILACASLLPDESNPSGSEATQPASTDLPPQATATLDAEGRIKSANILVYENTIGQELSLTSVIQNALDGMGMKYTQTGSDSGIFMENLKSEAIYDLIIVGAEAKNKPITGVFWDEINTRLTRDDQRYIERLRYSLPEGLSRGRFDLLVGFDAPDLQRTQCRTSPAALWSLLEETSRGPHPPCRRRRCNTAGGPRRGKLER
jgi:hypothetical protein